MKKRDILVLIIFLLISSLLIVFGKNVYNFTKNIFNYVFDSEEYLYGSIDTEKGRISLKVKLDNSDYIKEVEIIEYPNNDTSIQSLQKLIDNSLDKQSADEIDDVVDDMDTSNAYKSIIRNMFYNQSLVDIEDNNKKISLVEPENQFLIERVEKNKEGYKSGLGGYVINTFQDADYNRNGNLVTNEYICAVILNQYNRIEQVKFDHIVSNISFDRFGKIPTGNAKAYTFMSDKSKIGFNGLINDGNYIDIFDFEKQVLTYKHFEEIKNRYINKKGYAPFIYALENAIDNARFIGASVNEPMGLSVNKILKKKDIFDSTDDENGHVNFISNYCLITTDKSRSISSCMFDNVVNTAKITNTGKIFGSREKEVYTLNELSNTKKYSKIDESRYNMKLQLNTLADFMRGNSIDNMLKLISEYTDDKGIAKPDKAFADLKYIDFIEFIDLISRAYVDSIKIVKE